MGCVTKLFVYILALSSIGLLSGCKEEASKPVPPPDVTVGLPAKQEVTKYLEYTGTTAPLEKVEVRTRVKGYLQEINFSPRSHVQGRGCSVRDRS